MNEPEIGIIILAAGASTRMGEPKQLLRYEGETLLRRAVNAALASQCHPIIVVLGAQADILRAEIAGTQAQVIINQEWAEGMGSSIRCGLSALEALTAEAVSATVLMLCDQPFVSDQALNRLVKAYQLKGALLVAAEYAAQGEKIRGVPALFNRALFSELRNLQGHEGAKQIISRHQDEAEFVAMPEAAFDVDTPDEYKVLRAGDGMPTLIHGSHDLSLIDESLSAGELKISGKTADD